jgi:hypothetical protein
MKFTKRNIKNFLKYFSKRAIGFFAYPMFKIEKWAYVGGFGNLYKVSNKGRVISFHGNKKIFLTPIINKNGYSEVRLSNNGIKKAKSIHRLVASAFIPNPKNLETVNHKNFIKWDNTIWNLEWMSNEDNIQHSVNNGRHMVNRPQPTTRVIEARICSVCGEMKSLNEFNKNYSHCKSCIKEKNHRYYSENRDDILKSKGSLKRYNNTKWTAIN